MVITWAALESMAARLAVANASDADIKALRKFAMSQSETASKAELSEYSDTNIKFHQSILDLSGCELLRTTADDLFAHMYAVRRRAFPKVIAPAGRLPITWKLSRRWKDVKLNWLPALCVNIPCVCMIYSGEMDAA